MFCETYPQSTWNSSMLLYMLFILNFIFYVLQVYRNGFNNFKK